MYEHKIDDIAKNPDLVHKNYFLGLLYQRNGELEKAITALKKVVEKYPTQMYTGLLERLEKKLKETKKESQDSLKLI